MQNISVSYAPLCARGYFGLWVKPWGFRLLFLFRRCCPCPCGCVKRAFGPDGVLHLSFNSALFVFTPSHTDTICDAARLAQTSRTSVTEHQRRPELKQINHLWYVPQRLGPSAPLCPYFPQTFYIIMPEYLYRLNSKAADFLISYGAKKKKSGADIRSLLLLSSWWILGRIISVIDSAFALLCWHSFTATSERWAGSVFLFSLLLSTSSPFAGYNMSALCGACFVSFTQWSLKISISCLPRGTVY